MNIGFWVRRYKRNQVVRKRVFGNRIITPQNLVDYQIFAKVAFYLLNMATSRTIRNIPIDSSKPE